MKGIKFHQNIYNGFYKKCRVLRFSKIAIKPIEFFYWFFNALKKS